MKRKCIYCKETFEGRIDKKYCSAYCRSAWYYHQHKEKESTQFKKIDRQLKQNRKLLKNYNKAGLATIRKLELLQEGFNPNYFTHYWKNKRGQVYLFCYEYGFLAKEDKYILIQWQAYMER